MSSRILIVNDNSDTRSNSLAASFHKRGVSATSAPLAALAFDTSSPHGLSIPGFDGALPDAVLVRSIAAGSFEAITRRLGVLHALGQAFRAGVELRSGDRTLRRQVDDDVPAAAGRPADAADIRRRGPGSGARRSPPANFRDRRWC